MKKDEGGKADAETGRHGDAVNTSKAYGGTSTMREETQLLYAKHPRVSVSPCLRVRSSAFILALHP